MSIIVAENEVLYQAASFYAAELGILDDNFVVVIDESANMADDMYGLCHSFEHDDLQIEINISRSEKDKLITLAHEMVHVRQYIRQELEEADERHNVRWHGKDVAMPKDADSYWDAPWEVEAFSLQNKLYEAYYGSTL